jgi:sigma-B regulation protein RsbU (phosphoserine phosphatase)
MVTYSEPILRDGQFIGVVTADLSLAYFLQLKHWLDELQLSRNDYGFVVSRAGTLISDANPEYQMGRRIDEFAGPHAAPAFRELLDLIHRHEPGLVHGTDLWKGNPVRYLVAPVPSTGWSFVAVIPEL